MPSTSSSFNVNLVISVKGDVAAQARAFLEGPSGPIYGDLLRRGRAVESKAKQLCPINHGRLKSSITSAIDTSASLPTVRIGTNVEYAVWVHEGTGIYGPKHAPIVPVHAKFLVFKPKGSSKKVFAKSVKGMKGRPFLKNALPAAAR